MAIPEELKKNYYRTIAVKRIKNKEFVGSSPPSVFVSHYGYPKVEISPVSPTELIHNAGIYDTPEEWFGVPEEKILTMRHSLVHAVKKIQISEAKNPSYELTSLQEIAMSKNAVDVDVKLLKNPTPEIRFSDVLAPIGPKALLKKFQFEKNPKISKKVDYISSDTDLKSSNAMLELYDSGLNVSNIYKILSTGALGIKKNRKLVPTRWSITATDDTLSKNLVNEKIKFYSQIDEIQLFQSNYLDNRFFVILFPDAWQYEMLECWLAFDAVDKSKPPKIIQDFEGYGGRKNYASNITGAYYSARLGVAEYLEEQKKQAAVLVLREIGSDYKVPMGVWQIRENVRNAMQEKPMTFFDSKLLWKFLSQKLEVNIKYYKKLSKVVDSIVNQKKLSDWN